MIMSRERCFTHFEFNPQNRIVGKSLLIMKPCTSQWNNSLYAQRDFWCGFWASVLKVIITLSSCPEDTALPNQGGDAHHTQNSPGTTMPWSPAPPTAIYTQILCPAAWEWCHGYLLFFLGSMPSSSGITLIFWVIESPRGSGGSELVCYQVWPIPGFRTQCQLHRSTWPSCNNQNQPPWPGTIQGSLHPTPAPRNR